MSKEMYIPQTSIGISSSEEDDNNNFGNSLLKQLRLSATDPATMASNIEQLANLVEQIYVTTRDNNAILCQILSTVEENLNSKIDKTKAEILEYIDTKLDNLAALHESELRREVDGLRSSIGGMSIGAQTFMSSAPKGKLPGMAPPPASGVGQAATASAGTLSSAGSIAGSSSIHSRQAPRSSILGGRLPSVPEMSQTIYESVEIVPNPGFVIKTRKLKGNKDKVFINIFHHELIEVEPESATKTEAAALTEDNRPYLVMGEVTHILDKEGHNCSTYNVGISTEYFKQANNPAFNCQITSPVVIRKIIHKINLKYAEFLDESTYSLPRLASGYKGDFIPKMMIPVPSEKAPRPHAAPTHPQQPRGSLDLGVSRDSFDNESVMSDITTGTDTGALTSRPSFTSSMPTTRRSDSSAAHKKIVKRKSILESSASLSVANTGRNLLSGNMLEYIKEECIDSAHVEQLRSTAGKQPEVLLGWQVSVTLDNGSSDLYVVTDMRKNYMSKTEYRLSRYERDDLWVRLNRGDKKDGLEFRPLRQVLHGLQDDESVC